MQLLFRFISFYSFLASVLLLAAAEHPISYPVQWENVASNLSDSRNLESPYLGECMCDLTWGSCDPNCCCDSDCTVEEKNIFSFCLQETVGPPPLKYCYNEKQNKKATQTNRPYLHRINRGHRAVCIVRSNSIKDLIPFFVVPKDVPKPIPKESRDWIGLKESKGYVVNGDLLLMKRIEVGTSNYEMRSMGLFRIPSARQDGYCTSQGRRVRFMNPIEVTSCVLAGKDICMLFPTVGYESLFLADPGYSSSQSFIPIRLRIFNDTSGELLTQVDSNSKIPEEYQSVTNGNICENGVVQVRNSLVYNSNSKGLSLMSATTDLYIRDISAEKIASMFFEIKFSRSGVVPPSNYFSGTPGYSEGSRMRAGTLVEENGKSAIAEWVSGFSVPSGGRSCYKNNYRSVPFLYNVLNSGCTIPFSELELRNICSGTGTGTLLRSVLGLNTESPLEFNGITRPISHVARTNDALNNDTASWIKIKGLDFGEITPDPYDSVNRKCSNIYVGLHYTFVVSRIGAKTNPQNIILDAFVDPIIGSWSIQNTKDFTQNAVSIQRFRFLVSFTWVNSNLLTIMRRRVIPPPILPRLDDTVFYPFSAPK